MLLIYAGKSVNARYQTILNIHCYINFWDKFACHSLVWSEKLSESFYKNVY